MGDAFLSENTSPHQDIQNNTNKLAEATITAAEVLFNVILSRGDGQLPNVSLAIFSLTARAVLTEVVARFAPTGLQ